MKDQTIETMTSTIEAACNTKQKQVYESCNPTVTIIIAFLSMTVLQGYCGYD